jgi:MFS superfamily sulfate permease-like transporter
VVIPQCPVYRFDAPLIFANAATFRDEITRLANAESRPVWIIIAAEPITDIDTTAYEMLRTLSATLEGQGTRLVFAELKAAIVAKLSRFGLEQAGDEEHFMPTVNAALDAFIAANPAEVGQGDQTQA